MEWYTVDQAAEKIGLSVGATYRLCSGRRLTHRRVGEKRGSGRITISEQAIENFLNSCEVPVDDGPIGRKTYKPKPRTVASGACRPDGSPMVYLGHLAHEK